MSGVRIGILCDASTQIASVAPILDCVGSTRSAHGKPAIEVTLLFDRAHPPPSPLRPGALPVDLATDPTPYSVAVLPASALLEPTASGTADRTAAAWIRRQHHAGAHIAAIGSGVLLVAKAGLLQAGSAAVAPSLQTTFRRLFPSVAIVPAASPVAQHGRIITAGAPACAFHLATALARVAFSHAMAEGYAHRSGLAATPPPDTNPAPPPLQQHTDALVEDAQAWITQHLSENINAADLAAALQVSVRTMTRRFSATTGLTPNLYLRKARLDAAQTMLRRTRFSVDQIAAFVGYQDISFFRRIFKQAAGISPSTYRRSASTLQ